MRELLNLFSETESRDELGVGQVRDALSDSLFPGTSSLHTRARYLLIVPWCFQAAERGSAGSARTAQVEVNERKVVGNLKAAGATDGLIGRVAGIAVKTLPSTIYWTALAQYGIRRANGQDSSIASQVTASAETEELADRAAGMWHSTMPAIPIGFPNQIPGGLELYRDEALWLRDRMLTGATGSLLAHLLEDGHRPSPDSAAPWQDAAVRDAPAEPAVDLRHAKLFSLAIHGAALLYNLLVAERYERAGFTRVEHPIDVYEDALADWSEEIPKNGELRRWDRQDMWSRVTAQNPRIAANHGARRFIDDWLDAVVAGAASSWVASEDLRKIVRERERAVKRAQSRFVNEKLLRTWSGSSGRARLTFRWAQVSRMVTDVHNGLDLEASRAPA